MGADVHVQGRTHDASHVTTDPSLYVPQTFESDVLVLQLISVPQSVCRMQASCEEICVKITTETSHNGRNVQHWAEVHAH